MCILQWTCEILQFVSCHDPSHHIWSYLVYSPLSKDSLRRKKGFLYFSLKYWFLSTWLKFQYLRFKEEFSWNTLTFDHKINWPLKMASQWYEQLGGKHVLVYWCNKNSTRLVQTFANFLTKLNMYNSTIWVDTDPTISWIIIQQFWATKDPNLTKQFQLSISTIWIKFNHQISISNFHLNHSPSLECKDNSN